MASNPPRTASIPRAWIENDALDADALALASWISLKEPGTVLDIDAITARFSFSRAARQRALGALRELGLVQLRSLGGAGGFRGSRYVVTGPESPIAREPEKRALKEEEDSSSASASSPHRDRKTTSRRPWVHNPLTEGHFSAARVVIANTSARNEEGVAKIIRWGEDFGGMTPEQTTGHLVALHRQGRKVTLRELKAYLAETPVPHSVAGPRNHAPVPAPLVAPDPIGEAVVDLLQEFPSRRGAVLAAEELALHRGAPPTRDDVLALMRALGAVRAPSEAEAVAAARAACRAASGPVGAREVAAALRAARAAAEVDAARQRAREAAPAPARPGGLPSWWRTVRAAGWDSSMIPSLA